MARIPRQPIQDFTLRPVPGVVSTVPVDTSQLGQFGRILMNEGLTQAAENAKKEGIAAQAQVEDGTLVKRDSSFFGFFDAQFDEGAKYLYQKQKQNEIELVMKKAELDNPWNPNAFSEAIQAEREKVFAGVPADVLPGVKFFWDTQAKNTNFDVQKQSVVRELKFQQDQLALDVDEVTRAAELEMEMSGELSVPIEARLTALREKAGEMGMNEAEIAAMEIPVRERIFVSEKVHEYRQLPFEKRAGWMNNLLSDKGPLKDKSYLERLSIRSKIQAIDDGDKAVYAAELSGLKEAFRDAIKVRGRGHNFENISQLLAKGQVVYKATGDAELGKLMGNYVETENVQATMGQLKKSNANSVQSLMSELEKKDRSGKGLNPVESQVLNDSAALIEEMRQTDVTGEWHDFVRNNNVEPVPGFYEKSRAEQTELLSFMYGDYEVTDNGVQINRLANVNYFTKDEVDKQAEIFKSGTFAEQAATAKDLGDELAANPKYRDRAAMQIARKNPGLGTVAALLAQDEKTRKVGLDILEGREFRQTLGADFVAKPTDTKRNIATVVASTMPYRTSQTANAYAELVLDLYAKELKDDEKPATSALTVTKAKEVYERILGGEIWTSPSGRNTVPLRPGFTSSDNLDFWNAMTNDALKEMGGGEFPIDSRSQTREGVVVDWERIREDGILQPAGPGMFHVLMPPAPGQPGDPIPLMNRTNGQRFIFSSDLMPEPLLPTVSPLMAIEAP